MEKSPFELAKQAHDPMKLAQAIMKKAEEAGQSVTEWLADHAEDCKCGEHEEKGEPKEKSR